MSRHDDDVRLRHMLDHANEAIGMVRLRRREELEVDRQLNLALVRLLEVIGEAANRVSPATRDELRAVPWSQMVGMRNRLIHGYDDVDYGILWQIVTIDLPVLVAELEPYLARTDST